MDFFTSDLHLNHFNSIEYCNRPFSSTEEMNTAIIDNWNKSVTSKDTVYVLGDFIMGMRSESFKLRERLNGNIVLIRGDHDKNITDGRSHNLRVEQFMIYQRDKIKISLFHWCIRVWPKSHFNSWHLYGHCLDLSTEILTKDGWKFRNELNKTDDVLTLNLDNSQLEYNSIDEIVDYDYCGDVYSLQAKGIDFRVTSNHVMIDVERNKKLNYRKLYANELDKLKRRTFIKSGIFNNQGVELSDDYIKLLVWIAADGNLCNSDLIRIRVFKQRKIERIRALLDVLGVKYNELPQKDKSISFNFNIPEMLKLYSLKPIDKMIENLNTHQFEILITEYSYADGHAYNDTVMIYTSKKQEADSIQICGVKNGYMCNISKRENHGYSKKPNYQVAITKKEHQDCTTIRDMLNVETVNDEHFWCVCVKNKTIMIRRNGKPIIVGNSHGRLEPIGKSWDVGVDNNNFKPLSYDEIVTIMETRPDNPNLIKVEDRNRG